MKWKIGQYEVRPREIKFFTLTDYSCIRTGIVFSFKNIYHLGLVYYECTLLSE